MSQQIYTNVQSSQYEGRSCKPSHCGISLWFCSKNRKLWITVYATFIEKSQSFSLWTTMGGHYLICQLSMRIMSNRLWYSPSLFSKRYIYDMFLMHKIHGLAHIYLIINNELILKFTTWIFICSISIKQVYK